MMEIIRKLLEYSFKDVGDFPELTPKEREIIGSPENYQKLWDIIHGADPDKV